MLVIPIAGTSLSQSRQDFDALVSNPSSLVLIFGAPPDLSSGAAGTLDTAAVNTGLMPDVTWIQDPDGFLTDAEKGAWWNPDHPRVVVLTPGRKVSSRLDPSQADPWPVRVAVTNACATVEQP